MSTKTKTRRSYVKPTRRRLRLVEELQTVARFSKAENVDVAKGIIENVKVLGMVSDNGRIYTEKAIRKALADGIYEGTYVNTDHPQKPGVPRSVFDRLGQLEGIYAVFEGDPESDGLYAKRLILLQANEFAKTLLEAAAKMPGAFALSHNCDAKGFDNEEGIFVVEEIVSVRSVDLVGDGATNRTLFESRRMSKKTTLRQMIQSSKFDNALKAELLEAYEDAEEMDEGTDETLGDGEPNWRDHLKEAMGKLCESDDPNDHSHAKKLLGMLTARSETEEKEIDDPPDGKDPGKGGQTVKEEEEGEDDDPNSSKNLIREDEEGRRPRRRPGTRAVTEEVCSRLCKLAGLEPKKELLESLTSMGSQNAILKHLDWLKGQIVTRTPAERPKSRGQVLLEEKQERALTEDPDVALAFMRD